MSVSDISPKEAERLKAIEEAMQAKEAARIARIGLVCYKTIYKYHHNFTNELTNIQTYPQRPKRRRNTKRNSDTS